MTMREYQPFAYPPDFALARIHQEATKPGKIDLTTSIECPCCSRRTKQPLSTWLYRSIDQDFKHFGGAIVTYFWLVKIYAFVSLLILLVYSSYLLATIHNACPESQGKEGMTQCERFLGIYIVSNQQLFQLLQKLGKVESMTRIYTLRTIAYVILLIGNFMAVYTSGRFKRRYPQPKDISDFSLIFKNVSQSVQDLILELKQKFPEAEISQIFKIKTMQPFHTLYTQKLQIYYQSRIEKTPKKKQKQLKILEALDRKCSKEEHKYLQDSDRVIVVFQSEAQRNMIKSYYELKGVQKIKYLLGVQGHSEEKYCEECPTCQEIIWNNIGSDQDQKIKMKVLSIVYFFLLIAGSYVLLFFCMHLAYDRDVLKSPFNVIVANIIMTLMVPIALTFRQLMNRLSEMRRPNTLTNRTMFIVLTTVLFHFIYYIIIPTFYLNFSVKVEKNKVLTIITNQTFNFLLVQFILAYVDLVFCQWNRRLKRVADQENPIGCQKILHRHMEYPRFPIQFKLIILFKTFSFIILFAFESPFLMFLCFALLNFLYFTDKFAVYRHYRMEIIDNGVQYRFLKIYSVFFTAYTFLIYSLTQHFEDSKTEFYAALALAILAVLLQIFALKDRVFEDETILPSTLKQEKIEDSYKRRFDKFKQDIVDEATDLEIKEMLIKGGLGSLQTEQTLSRNKLIDS